MTKNIALVLVGLAVLSGTYFLGLTKGYYGQITSANYSSAFRNELRGKKLGDADLNLLWEVTKTIEDKYYGTPNYYDMVYGTIKGAVAALGDPYTIFTTPDENKEFFASLDGVYEGIGIEVDIIDEKLTIIAPLKESPAEKAGIRPNDQIVAINNEPVEGLSLSEVLVKIKGKSGTKVTLSIIRSDSAPFNVEIPRGVIKRDSVEMDIKDGIATVRIFRFGTDTNAKFRSAVDQIIAQNIKGVILDLRSNPGGFLDSGVAVANEFIKSGMIVEERFKNGSKTPFTADSKGRLTEVEVVVLVNGGSASAAEIVAGALQDNKRATVMGESTYGKGSVQEVAQFSDGSALRVTVAKWYTPAGNSISDEGVKPDKVVEYISGTVDNQLEEAKKLLSAKIK